MNIDAPSFWIGFSSGVVAVLLFIGTVSLCAMLYAFLFGDDIALQIPDKIDPQADEHEGAFV